VEQVEKVTINPGTTASTVGYGGGGGGETGMVHLGGSVEMARMAQ
jgi:hypothetical protein